MPPRAEGLAERFDSVRIETDGTPGSEDVAAACAAAVHAVQARGWKTPPVVIRVLHSPFDATAPASDLALGAGEPLADAFFRTVEALVRRDLSRVAPTIRAGEAARLVAAHLSPRGSALRRTWEREWVAALARGELVGTALLETVWRVGGDAMVRAATPAPWPEGLISALWERLKEDPTEAVSQVVLAGLLDPQALGFEVDAPALLAQGEHPTVQALAESVSLGVHLYRISTRAMAEGVSLLRNRGIVAHVVVRYSFGELYDVVPLAEGEEVAVPLRGVSWAGVVVTALGDGGAFSLSSRPLPEYPVAMEGWDFQAGDGTVTISWETRNHTDVLGFVVEALAREGGRDWRAVRRVFVPAADDGSQPFSYSFVETGAEDSELFRVSALTRRGFLAEVGTFPVATR